MSLNPDTLLGPYRILAPIGAGGMGEVYRARDTRLDRDVAVKVLPDAMARDAHALERFEREARAVAALSHPNIVAVHDVGRHDEVSYVVMELLEGETLRSRIARSALPQRKAVEIGACIADGLSAAHSKGVVHRDLKPDNVFLTSDGQVKILDFGLARSSVAERDATPEPAGAPTLTQAGSILGTPSYMAPEQVRGQPTDARTDIFAFGCLLYEMLTGRRAFHGETAADTMSAILKEEPAGPGADPEIDRLIDRCLEKRPEQRFQTAADLAFTLRSTASHAPAPAAAATPRWLLRWGIVALVLLATLASLFVLRPWNRRAAIDSIAVLPLENVSRDPEQEYFVDGMTEALISDLAKIGRLKVISRTSIMRYKVAAKSLPEIARELGVDAVVEGSVLRVGERVRISAQLIHAATDEHLWTESYDRDLRDVLQLQSEVARTIAHEIQIALTPKEQARIGTAAQVDPEAHQAYLEGRFYWNKRTRDGLRKAVDHFERALSLAPDWPLAHAGLADAYVLMPMYASMRSSEAMPRARAAAARALELDDSLGEAHATLATIAHYYDYDWPAAGREYERAIELSPNYATAHHWYALYLMHTSHPDDAIREMTRARELDPLSLVINSVLGQARFSAGRLDEAESGLRRTLELDPGFAMAHQNMATTLWLQGKVEEAIVENREAARLSDRPGHASSLAYLYAKTDRPEEARRILAALATRSMETYVPPTSFARIHLGLGETDLAFEWLERAYRERDMWLPNALIEPMLTPLRGDPRFEEIVRRVGLPPLRPPPAVHPSGR